MGWLLLFGLFCLLAVIGFILTGRPFEFAIGGIVFLAAFVFVIFITLVIWSLASPCTAPFNDCAYNTNTTPSVSSTANTTQQVPVSPEQTTQAPLASTGNGQMPPLVQYALPTAQYPSSKCVTESGVLICDLSYQSSDVTGDTRTIALQGNEVMCHNMTTGLNIDILGSTATISTDPTFCASDYGGVYIDPTIEVSKYYGAIQSSGQDYSVPSTEAVCLWTYEGGSAAVPYIQTGSYIGPDTSYDQVRAFCQSASNQLDIFSSSQ